MTENAEKTRPTFEDRTIVGLTECGKWLQDNAEQLASTICGGCTHWDITFSWDTLTDDPLCVPTIKINVNKYGKSIIDAMVAM